MKNVKRHFVKGMLVLAVGALGVLPAGCDYCLTGLAECCDNYFDGYSFDGDSDGGYGEASYGSYNYWGYHDCGNPFGMGGFSGPVDIDIDPGDINVGNINVGGQ